MRAAFLAIPLVLAACADGDDEPTISEFSTLIERSWTIPPGEQYKCVRIMAEEDMYLTQLHAIAPPGTHHTVVTVAEGGTLGEYDCDAGNLDLEMLFASGPGTDDLVFPEGVAIKIEAGQTINLNLHLFNTGTSDLSGTSGLDIRTIPESEVTDEAEMVFSGQASFTIPGETGSTPYVVSGGCEFSRGATILAYWPHMHQYAVHQKVTMTIGGEESVVHDEEYSFFEQKNYPVEPLVVAGGDSIEIECSYENHTGSSVGFGDSSTQEMCFTGFYRYPKQALHLFECSEGLGGF
jgi:hypothetical protein